MPQPNLKQTYFQNKTPIPAKQENPAASNVPASYAQNALQKQQQEKQIFDNITNSFKQGDYTRVVAMIQQGRKFGIHPGKLRQSIEASIEEQVQNTLKLKEKLLSFLK